MTDLAWMIFTVAVIGAVLAVVLYVTRRPHPPPATIRAPEFDALERIVEKAFEANQQIITTIATEVSRTAIESAKGALEGMTVGGTQQVLDTDEPEPPPFPDWTTAAIPDFIGAEPFPNPPTLPGEIPNG